MVEWPNMILPFDHLVKQTLDKWKSILPNDHDLKISKIPILPYAAFHSSHWPLTVWQRSARLSPNDRQMIRLHCHGIGIFWGIFLKSCILERPVTPFHLHYDHLSGMRCPRKFLASNASSSVYWDIFTQFHQKGNGIKLSNYCDSFSVPHALIRGRCVHACVGGSITEATPLCEIICATGGRSVNDEALWHLQVCQMRG